MSLRQELQRRKVPRTLLAYGAAAFIAAQVVQLLAEALDIGPWLLRALVILEIAALPFVIAFAWMFDASRTGVVVTAEANAPPRATVRWRLLALPFVASLALVVAAFYLIGDSSKTLNDELIAVLPFHVAGDPQISYLHEGMVDLLAAKLTGEGGPRAADPRGVMSVVRNHAQDGTELSDRKASSIGREVGTGHVLVGSVVGTPAQLTIHARMLRVPGGRIAAEAEQTGSADSLLVTIDRLVAKLLSLQAGEGSQRLDQLMTTSLPALRSYLDGKVAYRSGHFGRASELFAKAIEIDSTFALAGIGQFMTAGWGEGPRVDRLKARRTVIAHRDRLSPVDRAVAVAMWGEHADQPRSWKTRIADWDRAVTLAPDQLDALFWYADFVFHWGNTVDLPRAGERSDEIFQDILRKDSTYVPALLHRIDVAMRLDRTDIIRQLEPLRKQLDPQESAAHYQRSRRIRLLGDSAAISAERAALDTMSMDALTHAAAAAGTVPGAVTDALRAVDLRLKKATTRADQIDAHWDAIDRAYMWGMPARAERLTVALIELGEFDAHIIRVVAALYWDGEQRAGADAVTQLARRTSAETRLADRAYALCVTEQWRLWHNDTTQYRTTLRALGDVPRDSARLKILGDVCSQSLTVIRATVQRSPQLPKLVQSFNATMSEGPAVEPFLLNASNIILGRAAEQIGDRRLAQRAYGRYPTGNLITLELATTMMREQARLAALNGDYETAVRVYRKYLLLHERAEPALKKTDDAVRRHLARLTGERAND